MIKLIKKAWSDPVWSKVISTGIVAVVGFVVVWFGGLWPSVKTGFAASWSWLGQETQTSNWLLVLMGLATAAVVMFVLVLLWSAARGSATSLSFSFEDYVEDDFFDLRWRWSYWGNDVSGLATFCPRCDYQVHPRHAAAYSVVDRYAFACDECGTTLAEIEMSLDEFQSRARRKIQQKLRSREWVEAVTAMLERRKVVASKISA